MKQHPLSSAFPAMPAEQFQALKDSITDIGVQEPITLFEGMVIDGWHRYTAANELGMDCPTVDLGDVDPQAFVVAKNKARRHITMSQIATAVVAVYQWKPAHRPSNSAPGADLSKSTKQLAEIAGVGTRTIEQAKTVEAKATPEVKAAVKSGAMSVKKAAETVNPPKVKEETREPVEDYGPDDAELAANAAAAAADMRAMEKLLEEDDKLSAAFAEIKRLNAELAQVKQARDGYMNKSNELIGMVKKLQRQLDKAKAAA